MLRLIVMGCGRVFERYHLPALRAARDTRLVGVADPSAGRRAWACRALDGVPCFASVDALLNGVAADAALVTTPPEFHVPVAQQALQHGLPVLIEKPMALRRDDAQRICDLQQRQAAVVRVGFNRRFRTDYAGIRARIRGAMPIGGVHFHFTANAAHWNPTDSTPSTPADVLHDAGSHGFDLIAYVIGHPILRVRSVVQRRNATCRVTSHLRLADGTTAVCSVAHAPRFEEHLSAGYAGNVVRADVSGTTRSARLRSAAALGVRRLLRRPTPTDESFRRQLAEFTAACRGASGGIGADAHDGYRAVAVVGACLESLNNGGAWQDVLESSLTY